MLLQVRPFASVPARPAVRTTVNGQGSGNELLGAALASVVALQLAAVPLPVSALDYESMIKRPETEQVAPTTNLPVGVQRALSYYPNLNLPSSWLPSLPSLSLPPLPSLSSEDAVPTLRAALAEAEARAAEAEQQAAALLKKREVAEAALANAEAALAAAQAQAKSGAVAEVKEALVAAKVEALKAEVQADQAEETKVEAAEAQAETAAEQAEQRAAVLAKYEAEAERQAEAAKMQASAAFAKMQAQANEGTGQLSAMEKDEALLREEEQLEEKAIRALDQQISNERRVEKVEKAQLKKKNDALLAAVKAGDMSKVAALRKEILQLEADFEKEEKILAALITEEKAEKAIEDKQVAKINAERAEEAATESAARALDADSSSAAM